MKETWLVCAQPSTDIPDSQTRPLWYFPSYAFNLEINSNLVGNPYFGSGFRLSEVNPQSRSCSRPDMLHQKKVEYCYIGEKECHREYLHHTARPVTQSTPSPMILCTESVPQDAHVSHIETNDSKHGQSSSCNGPSGSGVLHDVHISGRLMEEFLELARDNTTKDLETCGILSAFLQKGTFYVTTLIIPKQESTSNSCQAVQEEEMFAIQNENSLFPVGWIHTHPSQSCFMSSVDLHTHYSYQAMVPEAFAIVMAPTDASRNYGIFRLSDPGGMDILRDCQEKGFHHHEEPADGSSVYGHCSNVYINPNLRFEIFDLR